MSDASFEKNHLRLIWTQFIILLGKRRAYLIATLIPLSWFILGIFHQASSWLDYALLDFVQRAGMYYRAPHPDIQIVAIDTETLDSIKYRWPWPRSELARLLEIIRAGNPKFLIMDILLQHPDLGDEGKGDQALEKVIKDIGHVGLVSLVEETTTSSGLKLQQFRNLKIFRQAATLEGFVWAVVDGDGRIRSFVCKDERIEVESCVWQAAKKLDPNLPPPPLTEKGIARSLISFAKKDGGIPHIRAIDLMNGAIPASALKDKILVLGVTAFILHDHHQTLRGLTPGAEILAYTLDTLLRRQTARQLNDFYSRFFSAAFGGLSGLFLFYFLRKYLYLTSFVSMLAITTGGLFACDFLRVFPPFAPMILAWSFTALSIFIANTFLNFLAVQFVKAEAIAAGRIQSLFFPHDRWISPQGYSCQGFCIPCEEVGGDYFDIIPQKDGSMLFLISDVSGHGFSAALVTTMAKTVTSLLDSWEQLTPVNLLLTFNTIFYRLLHKKKMMTVFVVHLDPVKNIISMISAGHLPAVLVNSTGKTQEIGHPSWPLGMRENYKQKVIEMPMNPGDSLVLYTDGIVEALNWEDKQFGYDEWLASLGRIIPTFSDDTDLNEILTDVHTHACGRPFTDDVTLLMLRRKKN